MRTATRAGALGALGVLALAGCTSAPAPLPPAPISPVAASPTTCEINYNGPPDTPSALHLDCASTHWSMSGPWEDGHVRDPEQGAQALDGMKFTRAVIVGGEARAWVSTKTLSCVATRDLFDTDQDTRVRCHTPESETTAQPTETAPLPPSA